MWFNGRLYLQWGRSKILYFSRLLSTMRCQWIETFEWIILRQAVYTFSWTLYNWSWNWCTSAGFLECSWYSSRSKMGHNRLIHAGKCCPYEKEKKTWYGVIDENHSLLAVFDVKIDYLKTWSTFWWYVTVVRIGFTMERYAQVQRSQKVRQEAKCFIDATVFDFLKGLREKHDQLLQQHFQ